MKRANTVGAAALLAALALGLVLAVSSFFGGEGHLEALLKGGDPAAVLEGAESALNQDLDEDHLFIQLYGGFQRLAGRRLIEDPVEDNSVVRLSNGTLNFINLLSSDKPGPAVADNAQAAADFAGAVEALGIPCLYVAAPQKIQRDSNLLPVGLAENGNSSCDALLSALEEAGADTLDLRPLFEENGVYADWFFRTDHHWRPEGAFFAWQYLTRTVDVLATDPALTDPASWDTQVLEDFFLGSQGKRVGSLYAGTDDFTVYTPKFETDLHYTCPFYAIDREGPFNQSVCFPERIAGQDWFGGNPYTYYAGGDYPLASIVNRKNPEGPKVLLVRDSFACALTPFLALSCSELITVDLRYFQGDLLETVEAQQPDLVLTLYTASSTGNPEMFSYAGPDGE